MARKKGVKRKRTDSTKEITTNEKPTLLPEPKDQPNPTVLSQPESTIPPKPKAQPKSTVQPKPKVQPKPTVQPKPKVQPKSTVQPKPKVQPKSKAQRKSTVQPKPKVQPKSKVQRKVLIPKNAAEIDIDTLQEEKPVADIAGVDFEMVPSNNEEHVREDDIGEEVRDDIAGVDFEMVPSNSEEEKHVRDVDEVLSNKEEEDKVALAEAAELERRAMRLADPLPRPPKLESKYNALVLFVGNIHFDVTHEDLVGLFGNSDGLVAVRCLYTLDNPRTFRGSAFVEFKTLEAYQAGLDLSGHRFFGRPIKVELTAGGGGNSRRRLDKIATRNELYLKKKRIFEKRLKKGVARGIKKI